MKPEISIIIPAYNESATLNITLQHTLDTAQTDRFEIIVVSADDEEEQATDISDSAIRQTYLRSPIARRSSQMNQGAAHAQGRILLFLHADTLLPEHWDTLILEKKSADYGCFAKTFDDYRLFFRLNAGYCNLRSRMRCYDMGDHAIFVKKTIFEHIRGYADLSIMADVDLSKRLCGYRKKMIQTPVITSARRYQKNGLLKTWYQNQKIKIMYFFGADDETLSRLR